MASPIHVSAPLSPGNVSVGLGDHWRFIQVFCWMQLAMVVTNLGRMRVLSTSDREFPLGFNELCLSVILLAAALTVRSWGSVFIDRISVTALVFILIGGGSAVWSVERFGMGPIELFVSLAYLGRWVMYFALYVALINTLREANLEAVWRAVETMLVVFALFGIVQTAFLPNFAQTIDPESRSFNWDEQGHRLISTVLEPNIAGAMLMIGVLVQAARITAGVEVQWPRLLIMFTGLTLTLSRSAAVGMFFGGLVILSAQGLSRRLLKVLGVVGILVVLVSPLLVQYLLAYNKFSFGEGSSAAARFVVWLQAIRVVADYPVFGVGFNAYRYAVASYGVKSLGGSSYGAEGGLLFVTAMTGFVGLTVYCAMVGQLFARCRLIWRDVTVPPNQRGMAVGAAASTIAVIFASIFVNALLTTFVMELLWVLWAITFVIVRARSARAAPPEPPIPKLVTLVA